MAAGRLAVEIYYDGAWHDITADDDVLAAPIVIKRGQSDEATQLRPASLVAQLANDDDRYRITNPLSPLYGKAGLNSQVRVSVDGTVRTVIEASSWAADQTQDFRRFPPRGKAWVDLEGGGLLQRIGGWTELVTSTMIKGILSFGTHLIGGWPLEDDSQASILSNVAPYGAAGEFTDITLADSERPAGSARSVKLGSTGHIFGTCNRSSSTAGWQISFAFKLPAVPSSATYEHIFDWYDSTGRKWSWEINNANFAWSVYDPDSTLLSNVASSYGTVTPDQWIRVRMKCSVSGSTVTYEPAWYPEGGDTLTGTSITFSGTETGQPTRWGATAATWNNGAWYTGVFAVDQATAEVFNAGVLADFNGHAGETAGDRAARLMTDLGIAYTILGDTAASALMGGQPEGTFADLLKEIISTDDALVFDDIDAIGLVVMLRNARYNQTPAVQLHATDLPGLPQEVTDNLGVYNVVTVSQRDGGALTATDDTSPKGTQDPPDGVGEIKRSVDVNVADEAVDLPQQANWWLRRGTVNLPRFPQLVVNLGALDAVTAAAVDAVDVGEVIELLDVRENVIRLQVIGYTETIRPADRGTVRRTIVFTCIPDQQFVTGVYDGTTAYTPKYDLGSATLTSKVAPNGTSITMTITDNEAWSTTAGYDLFISGARVTVTAMNARTGTGPYAQTGTIRWGANGIVKELPAGAEVHIATPGRYGL